MHYAGGLTIALTLFCAYHALSRGADRWVFIILFFPLIGSALYLFMEVLPHAKLRRAASSAGADILSKVDPERNLRALREKVEMTGSVKNKHELAREMVNMRMYDDAVELLRQLPFGPFQDDPYILQDLALAYFMRQSYQEALITLDKLKAANPDFKSQDAHLIYCRSLENMGRWEEALLDYESLTRYYSGMEAKCRMGLLLQKMGHTERAGAVFQEILDKARKNSADFYTREKEWIQIAQRFHK